MFSEIKFIAVLKQCYDRKQYLAFVWMCSELYYKWNVDYQLITSRIKHLSWPVPVHVWHWVRPSPLHFQHRSRPLPIHFQQRSRSTPLLKLGLCPSPWHEKHDSFEFSKFFIEFLINVFLVLSDSLYYPSVAIAGQASLSADSATWMTHSKRCSIRYFHLWDLILK